jgi:hypothetical protein
MKNPIEKIDISKKFEFSPSIGAQKLLLTQNIVAAIGDRGY